MTNKLKAQLVCKQWYLIMTDESTWRQAFLYHFHQLPLNRINKISWKVEYLLRIEIEKSWSISQHHLMVDPRMMRLDRVSMMQDGISIGSLSSGIVMNCDPKTGKLSRHVLYVNQDSDPMAIGAMEFYNNIVVVGTLSGSILLAKHGKNQVWGDWYVFNRFHQSIVSAIGFICESMFLSCSDDGIIKLWDYQECRLITTFVGNSDSVTVVASIDDLVIAGTEQGRICRWRLPLDKDPCEDVLIDHQVSIETAIEAIYKNATKTFCLLYTREQSQPFYILSDIGSTMDVKKVPGYHTNIVTSAFFYASTSDKESILLSGDVTGKVAIWVNPFKPDAYPTRILDNHICAISCLLYTPSVLVTGGVDGTVFVIDSVKLTNLSALNARYKNTALSERRIVKGIMYEKGVLITLQGDVLHSWCKRQRKSLTTPKQKQKKISIQHLRSSGGSQREHFKEQVYLAMDELENEKIQKRESENRQELFNGSPKVHGLDEDDLVSYAMMLSMENTAVVEPLSEQESLDLALALSISENLK